MMFSIISLIIITLTIIYHNIIPIYSQSISNNNTFNPFIRTITGGRCNPAYNNINPIPDPTALSESLYSPKLNALFYLYNTQLNIFNLTNHQSYIIPIDPAVLLLPFNNPNRGIISSINLGGVINNAETHIYFTVDNSIRSINLYSTIPTVNNPYGLYYNVSKLVGPPYRSGTSTDEFCDFASVSKPVILKQYDQINGVRLWD